MVLGVPFLGYMSHCPYYVSPESKLPALVTPHRIVTIISWRVRACRQGEIGSFKISDERFDCTVSLRRVDSMGWKHQSLAV
jgi:hypothetical protein